MNLVGKTVVITRALEQSEKMAQRLRDWGAKTLFYPCIQIVPPADVGPVQRAAEMLARGEFDGVVFTSANAVEMFPFFHNGKIWAIGRGTGQAIERIFGIQAEILPEESSAEALARHIGNCNGQRILLPMGNLARPVLQQMLAQRGAKVTQVVCYQTVRGTGGVALWPMLLRGEIDVIAFASPSAVRFCIERLREETNSSVILEHLRGVQSVCIGKTTLAEAERIGLLATIETEWFSSLSTTEL